MPFKNKRARIKKNQMVGITAVIESNKKSLITLPR